MMDGVIGTVRYARSVQNRDGSLSGGERDNYPVAFKEYCGVTDSRRTVGGSNVRGRAAIGSDLACERRTRVVSRTRSSLSLYV